MTSVLASRAKPTFTFINNDAAAGDRLTADQQKTVRKHCRNRWRQEREDSRKIQPEIRIIKFGAAAAAAAAASHTSHPPNTNAKVRKPLHQPPKSNVNPQARNHDHSTKLTAAAKGSRRNSPNPATTVSSTTRADEDSAITAQTSLRLDLCAVDDQFRSYDPFDTLPLPSSKTTGELIHYYIHQHMHSYTRLEPSSDLARARRRSFWTPLASHDEAAYCALMAHLQTDEYTPAHLKHPGLLQVCHSRAISLTNQRLRDASAMLDTATLYAVGMLNFVSWSTMDFNGMMIHGRGFETIIACRSGRYIDAGGYYASALLQHATMSKTKGYEHGFVDICNKGLIDADLSHPFRFYLGRLSYVLELDREATCLLLDHIVLNPCDIADEAQSLPTDPKKQLQHACHAAIHICSFLVFANPWSFQGTHSNLGLEECVDQVHRCIFAHDWEARCNEIWTKYPLLLLWLAVVSGSATRSAAKRQDFKWLLEETKAKMRLYDLKSAVDLMSTFFTWPDSLYYRTQHFWSDNETPARSERLVKQTRPFGTLCIKEMKGSKDTSPEIDETIDVRGSSSETEAFDESEEYQADLLVNPHASTWFYQDSPFEKPLRDKHCFLMAMQLMLNHIYETG